MRTKAPEVDQYDQKISKFLKDMYNHTEKFGFFLNLKEFNVFRSNYQLPGLKHKDFKRYKEDARMRSKVSA
jgi:hypothetical protein